MINKLSLTNIAVHKQKEITFKKGINAIIGENRKGKTTLLEAICFAVWGKTKNSKINNIISFGETTATSAIELDKYNFSRIRSKNTSKLEGITPEQLTSAINLDYLEFLRIFYMSSNERMSLFEPAYFRKFLIGLFNLEKYSKKYEQLKIEYNVLNNVVVDNAPKINKQIYMGRIKKIEDKKTYLEEALTKINNAFNEYNKYHSDLKYKLGQFDSYIQTELKKTNIKNITNCPTCKQCVNQEHKNKIIMEANKQIAHYKTMIVPINKAIKELMPKIEKANALRDKAVNKIDKCERLIDKINEKLNYKPPVINKQRISDLQKILSILAPNGFPSYLLKVYIPAIQSTCNDLLKLVFEDMSIEIRTERPESNIPDLTILVKKENNTIELDDCCGSETVLINLCLRLGVLVIFKQLNNTIVDFMLIDEGLEKLDNNISLKIIELFNKFINMSYIKQIILVTHKDILKDVKTINYIKL